MELIYTNHDFVEQGIIQDFELDLAYGTDENDFELVTQEPLEVGMYWYIENTEYGGVIDRIKTDKNNVTYYGRSWFGLLASHHGYEVSVLSGDVIEVLNHILYSTDLNLIIDENDCSLRPIEDTYVDRWQDLLNILLHICAVNRMKLKMYYDEGIHISLQDNADFTQDAYFDMSDYSVSMETSTVVPNHWIGRNKTETKEYVKHIFLDGEGKVIPFYRSTDSSVTTDADYEYPSTEYGQVLFGLDEVTQTVELENSKEDVFAKPIPFNEDKTEGNIEFDGNVPFDWSEKYYTDYYYIKDFDEEGNPVYTNYEKKYTYSRYYAVSGDWWDAHWSDYFKQDGYDEQGNPKYTQLTTDDIELPMTEHLLTSKPADWETNYSRYYTKDVQGQFQSVEGVSKMGYVKIIMDTPPSDFRLNPQNIYIQHSYRKWLVKGYERPSGRGSWKLVSEKTMYKSMNSSTYTTGWALGRSGGVKLNTLAPFKNGIQGNSDKWENKSSKATEKIVIYQPTWYTVWEDLLTYCKATGNNVNKLVWKSNTYAYYTEVGKEAPPFKANTYYDWYSRVAYGVPDPTGEYYQRYDATEVFSTADTYRKFENHYKPLADKIMEELEKVQQQTNKISAKLDTDVADFDVGDIIGGVQNNIEVKSVIGKKIVKASPFKIEVSYEIG